MPELPEVETMRRTIAHALGGVVDSVTIPRIAKQPLRTNVPWSRIRRAVAGKRITTIDRRGKRLILSFNDRHHLVIEPRMTGLIVVDDEPTRDHLRFEIALSESRCPRIAFWDQRGLGQVHLFNNAQLADYLSPRRIGPDALTITAGELQANLGQRTIAVKVGLLDQKAVAGIGNIYASEILHLSGVDPRKRCQRVAKKLWPRIHADMLEVLNTAIRMEGSTLSDGTYRNKWNEAGGYQNHHRVYDREGTMCPTCGEGIIRRLVQAQRSTYFCPACQR